MEILLDRRLVIVLAIVGGIFAALASWLQMRGTIGEKRARILNYAAYGFMGASMLLFVLAGMRPA
jgi:uncharacterized protein with PQ loop repeat